MGNYSPLSKFMCTSPNMGGGRGPARMNEDSPLEGNAFGYAMQKTGGDYKKAKAMVEGKGSAMQMKGKKVIITDEKGREHPTDSRSAEAKHKRAQHKGRGDSHLDDQ